MANIYLAGRFSKKHTLQRVSRSLKEQQHSITSRWLEGSHKDVTDNALMDLTDIDRADTVVFLLDEPDAHERPLQNTLVELGYALAKEKTVYVLDRLVSTEIIFLKLPSVRFINDWPELLVRLKQQEAESRRVDEISLPHVPV